MITAFSAATAFAQAATVGQAANAFAATATVGQAANAFAATATGGSPPVNAVGGAAPTAVAAILVFFVAIVLSILVTYRYAAGYLRTRQRPLLALAVGMFLLAPAPMFIRLVVGNVPVIGPTERTLVVTISKLCGLLAILSVVHRS